MGDTILLPSSTDTLIRYRELLISNPLNILLLLGLLYLSVPLLLSFLPPSKAALEQRVSPIPTSHTSGSYTWMPSSFPPATVWRSYTPYELRPNDGSANGPIFFAIRGKVYDVSTGRNFYGPGGPYGNFAGRDASRGLAKQSFDADMLTPIDAPIDDLADLTASERENLREWEGHFRNKYTVIGDFVEPQ